MKIERFVPLDGCGLIAIDMNTCLLLPVFHQDVERPDYPEPGIVSQVIYQSADEKHWYEEVRSFEPYDRNREPIFRQEVTPWYAAQELGEAGKRIPRFLSPYWKAIQEFKQTVPWQGGGKLFDQQDDPGVPLAWIDPVEDPETATRIAVEYKEKHPEAVKRFVDAYKKRTEEERDSFRGFIEGATRQANGRWRDLLSRHGVEPGGDVPSIVTTTYHLLNHLAKNRGFRGTLDGRNARCTSENALFLEGRVVQIDLTTCDICEIARGYDLIIPQKEHEPALLVGRWDRRERRYALDPACGHRLWEITQEAADSWIGDDNPFFSPSGPPPALGSPPAPPTEILVSPRWTGAHTPSWIRVAREDEDETTDSSPIVDLNRCKLWVPYSRFAESLDDTPLGLYRTPGNRWILIAQTICEHTGFPCIAMRFISDIQADAIFLENPGITPPDEVRERIEALDATNQPVPGQEYNHDGVSPSLLAKPVVDLTTRETLGMRALPLSTRPTTPLAISQEMTTAPARMGSEEPTATKIEADVVRGRAPRQQRLKAVLDANPPYFLLDGVRLDCKRETAVHYVARLIEANGERVAFSEWRGEHPEFEAERSNRVFNALPQQVHDLIERGQGKEPKLRVEALD